MDKKLISLAKRIAVAKEDDRKNRHGAVGIRKDGAIVASSNGNPKHPSRKHHAEYRVIRKTGKGGDLYVVRVMKNGKLGDSTPCHACQKLIRSKGIRVVYYSGSNGEICTWVPSSGYIKRSSATLSGSVSVLKGLYAWLPSKDSPGTFFGVNREQPPQSAVKPLTKADLEYLGAMEEAESV